MKHPNQQIKSMFANSIWLYYTYVWYYASLNQSPHMLQIEMTKIKRETSVPTCTNRKHSGFWCMFYFFINTRRWHWATWSVLMGRLSDVSDSAFDGCWYGAQALAKMRQPLKPALFRRCGNCPKYIEHIWGSGFCKYKIRNIFIFFYEI